LAGEEAEGVQIAQEGLPEGETKAAPKSETASAGE
jgi:hypothetical protein